MNTACVFCAIAAGEPNAGVVAQDAHTITLLDPRERHHGHLLVAPRHHCPEIRDMDEAAIDAVFLAVKRAVHCVDQEFPGEGLRVWQSTKSPSMTCIVHAHFHIHPRRIASPGADRRTSAGADLSAISTPAFIERLRRHMLDTRFALNEQVTAITPPDESQSIFRCWTAHSFLWCGCSERVAA